MGYEKKMKELGILLPQTPRPVAAYVPAVRTGNLVFTSGQLPVVDGKLAYTGRLGEDLTVEDGCQAARICALNALAAVRSVIGDLDRVRRIVKLNGYVAGGRGFSQQPQVMNGASLLLTEIFGEAGKHARSAVGTNGLPLNAPVELELVVEFGVPWRIGRKLQAF